jgi:hypothetical protein
LSNGPGPEETVAYIRRWREKGSGAPREASEQVKIRDRRCIAWTLPREVPFPPGVYTLAQAREAGLPVIEGLEVSIRMAVEDGWYTRPGSKWQTLPSLMLQYRAAAFFGRLHAPDLLLGMLTVEENREALDAERVGEGEYVVWTKTGREPKSVDDLRPEVAKGGPGAAVSGARFDETGSEPEGDVGELRWYPSAQQWVDRRNILFDPMLHAMSAADKTRPAVREAGIFRLRKGATPSARRHRGPPPARL